MMYCYPDFQNNYMDSNILSLFKEQCSGLESCTHHKGKGKRIITADALNRDR